AVADAFVADVPVSQCRSSMCSSEDPCEGGEGRTSRWCIKTHKIEHLIMRLNDPHRWTRERIAEWLAHQEQILGTQFSILESGEGFNTGQNRACPLCGLVRLGFGYLVCHMA